MINSLTKEQEALLPKYTEMGIKIGLATEDYSLSEEELRSITDDHRVLCGIPKAETFKVFDSPFAVTRHEPKCTAYNAFYGQHDINWLIFYQFFRNECGLIKETDKLIHLTKLTKTGWIWMDGTTTYVSRRPIDIRLLAKASGLRVLHNPTGMAVTYKDGTGLYNLDGLTIPLEYKDLLMAHPTSEEDKKALATKILKVSNTEIRGALLKSKGTDFLLLSLPTKKIHSATITNGGDYQLYELDIEGSRRRYLSGVCPSKGDRWYEAVPPEVSSCQQALLWREWGTMEGTYLAPRIRT